MHAAVPERSFWPPHERAATGNDYQKDRQFRKINSAKDTIDVAVVRGGKQLVVSNVDVVVGDVMLLDTGDKARSSLAPDRLYFHVKWLG